MLRRLAPGVAMMETAIVRVLAAITLFLYIANVANQTEVEAINETTQPHLLIRNRVLHAAELSCCSGRSRSPSVIWQG
jgi:hypothetical protein